MRHHTEDVLLHIADTRDIFQRTIWIGLRSHISIGITVSEDDLVVVVELLNSIGMVEVSTLAMGNWNLEYFIAKPLGDGSRLGSSFKVYVLADEFL